VDPRQAPLFQALSIVLMRYDRWFGVGVGPSSGDIALLCVCFSFKIQWSGYS